MIAAVTLDATGTLFAPGDLAADYARILGRHGVALERARLATLLPEVWREFACVADPSRDRFASHPGGARGFWRDVVDRVTARAGAPRASPFAVAELYDHFARAAAWRVYDEVPAALSRLAAAGVRLAVVSNWDERLPRLLHELGLAERFAAIVVSAEVGVEKPHPRIFAVAAERLGEPPERILHVGDRRLEDVEGAQAAGLRALWLARDGGGDLADLAALPERLAVLA
ncbi:MAG: HAD-IA family hydrolase [Thermoanaerobaculia bacterium]|nr:HAD-IA family hydrolase [Thermoanaerobaculia bacterium]